MKGGLGPWIEGVDVIVDEAHLICTK